MTVLSSEEQEYVGRVRDLAATRLLPLVEQGVEGRVNRPLLAAMGEHGLLRGHVLWRLAPVILAGLRGLHVRTAEVIYDCHEASHLPCVPVEHPFDFRHPRQ